MINLSKAKGVLEASRFLVWVYKDTVADGGGGRGGGFLNNEISDRATSRGRVKEFFITSSEKMFKQFKGGKGGIRKSG